jgi:hypothetical protein
MATIRVSALGVSQASWNPAGTSDSVMTIIEYAVGHNGVPGLAQTHVRTFAAAVRGEGRLTATGEDGLRALNVALAVGKSLKIGKTVNLTNLG